MLTFFRFLHQQLNILVSTAFARNMQRSVTLVVGILSVDASERVDYLLVVSSYTNTRVSSGDACKPLE